MSPIELLQRSVSSSMKAKQTLLTDSDFHERFQRAVALLIATYKNGGRLYIGGNGGSAADAQHLAAEFVSKLAKPRSPMPAEALTVDTSTITAIGNDYGFEELFARQIQAKVSPNDVFLAITTSGQSKNILRALEVCREKKIPSILLGGKSGGPAKDLADHWLVVPGEETSTIQECHMVVYHSLCGAVESALFP